ncbi:hypothetical protein P7C70_g3124, partial [Phenoliferia sp. Uapishka_3]
MTRPLGPLRSQPRLLRALQPSDTYKEGMAYEQRTIGGTLKPGFRGSPAEALRALSAAPAPLKPLKVVIGGKQRRSAAHVDPKAALLSRTSAPRPKQAKAQASRAHSTQSAREARDESASPAPHCSDAEDSGDSDGEGHDHPNALSSSPARQASLPPSPARSASPAATDQGDVDSGDDVDPAAQASDHESVDANYDSQYERAGMGPGSDDSQSRPGTTGGAGSPSPSPTPSPERPTKTSKAQEKAAKDKAAAREAAMVKKAKRIKAQKARAKAQAKAKLATPINPKTKTKQGELPSSPDRSPIRKKKASKSRKSQAKLDNEALYERTSFPAVFDTDIPQNQPRRRKSGSTSKPKSDSKDKEVPRPVKSESGSHTFSHIRHQGGRGSGSQGQFVFADMDVVERSTYASMCIEVRIRLVKDGKPWASAGDLQEVVNDMLTRARVDLQLEISWHAGFQAQLYQNAKSWISKCGREIKIKVMAKYKLSFDFTNKGRGEVQFSPASMKIAAAALRSCEILRADGQADVNDDGNMLLGSLLHESTVCLLGSMIALPALVLERGDERDHCVLLGFGLLGIAYAGILRTLEHAKEGSGSWEFNDDYQVEASYLSLTGRNLTVAQQDIILLKLWRLAGAHAAGLGKLAKVEESADAAKKALFRNRG